MVIHITNAVVSRSDNRQSLAAVQHWTVYLSNLFRPVPCCCRLQIASNHLVVRSIPYLKLRE
jgi:hypothetical protein